MISGRDDGQVAAVLDSLSAHGGIQQGDIRSKVIPAVSLLDLDDELRRQICIKLLLCHATGLRDDFRVPPRRKEIQLTSQAKPMV